MKSGPLHLETQYSEDKINFKSFEGSTLKQ